MMKRIIIVIALLLTLSLNSGFAQVLESNTLSKDTILIGDQVEWNARFNVPDGLTLKIDSMAGYVVPGVELLEDFKFEIVKQGKESSQIRAKALITSFDSGSYKMPPLVVYIYRGEELADTIRMNSIPLEVTTIPIDTATYQMYDLRSNFNYPVTFAEVAKWGGLAIALIAIVSLIVYLIIKNRRKKVEYQAPQKKDPPHIIALRALDMITSEKLWQNGKEKLFYTKVTDTLRLYIEERFNVNTMERTSAEILSDMKELEISPADYELISSLFATSDLVKFAKYKATQQENEEVIPIAVKFVTNTYKRDE